MKKIIYSLLILPVIFLIIPSASAQELNVLPLSNPSCSAQPNQILVGKLEQQEYVIITANVFGGSGDFTYEWTINSSISNESTSFSTNTDTIKRLALAQSGTFKVNVVIKDNISNKSTSASCSYEVKYQNITDMIDTPPPTLVHPNDGNFFGPWGWRVGSSQIGRTYTPLLASGEDKPMAVVINGSFYDMSRLRKGEYTYDGIKNLLEGTYTWSAHYASGGTRSSLRSFTVDKTAPTGSFNIYYSTGQEWPWDGGAPVGKKRTDTIYFTPNFSDNAAGVSLSFTIERGVKDRNASSFSYSSIQTAKLEPVVRNENKLYDTLPSQYLENGAPKPGMSFKYKVTVYDQVGNANIFESNTITPVAYVNEPPPACSDSKAANYGEAGSCYYNACGDGRDNDSDGFTDENDPGCHTDQNAQNSSSYNPSLNDEVSPLVKDLTVSCKYENGDPVPGCEFTGFGYKKVLINGKQTFPVNRWRPGAVVITNPNEDKLISSKSNGIQINETTSRLDWQMIGFHCGSNKDSQGYTYPQNACQTILGSNFNSEFNKQDLSTNNFNFVFAPSPESLTYCGDGLVQQPNQTGTGGKMNDGYEECDGGNECDSNCKILRPILMPIKIDSITSPSGACPGDNIKVSWSGSNLPAECVTAASTSILNGWNGNRVSSGTTGGFKEGVSIPPSASSGTYYLGLSCGNNSESIILPRYEDNRAGAVTVLPTSHPSCATFSLTNLFVKDRWDNNRATIVDGQAVYLNWSGTNIGNAACRVTSSPAAVNYNPPAGTTKTGLFSPRVQNNQTTNYTFTISCAGQQKTANLTVLPRPTIPASSRVIDSVTKQPISGINILKNGTSIGATNSAGIFNHQALKGDILTLTVDLNSTNYTKKEAVNSRVPGGFYQYQVMGLNCSNPTIGEPSCRDWLDASYPNKAALAFGSTFLTNISTHDVNDSGGNFNYDFKLTPASSSTKSLSASCSVFPGQPSVNDTIYFTLSPEGGSGKYSYNWGNFSTLTQSQITKSYPTPGQKAVTGEVYDKTTGEKITVGCSVIVLQSSEKPPITTDPDPLCGNSIVEAGETCEIGINGHTPVTCQNCQTVTTPSPPQTADIKIKAQLVSSSGEYIADWNDNLPPLSVSYFNNEFALKTSPFIKQVPRGKDFDLIVKVPSGYSVFSVSPDGFQQLYNYIYFFKQKISQTFWDNPFAWLLNKVLAEDLDHVYTIQLYGPPITTDSDPNPENQNPITTDPNSEDQDPITTDPNLDPEYPAPFCGDGIRNQDNEECDGESYCDANCKLIPVVTCSVDSPRLNLIRGARADINNIISCSGDSIPNSLSSQYIKNIIGPSGQTYSFISGTTKFEPQESGEYRIQLNFPGYYFAGDGSDTFSAQINVYTPNAGEE